QINYHNQTFLSIMATNHYQDMKFFDAPQCQWCTQILRDYTVVHKPWLYCTDCNFVFSGDVADMDLVKKEDTMVQLGNGVHKVELDSSDEGSSEFLSAQEDLLDSDMQDSQVQ
ncbi:unnamed protein product, partial [Meganyctiphanes norvegica]